MDPRHDGLVTTQPYVPADKMKKGSKAVVIMTMMVMSIGVGLGIGWHLRRKPPAASLPAAVILDHTSSSSRGDPDFTLQQREEVARQSRQAMLTALRNECCGVLIIKDGLAQTVLHKRAAISGEFGFTDLSETAYPVHVYAVSKDLSQGVGVAGYLEGPIFLVVWQKGEQPPPNRLLGLSLPGGRRVAAE